MSDPVNVSVLLPVFNCQSTVAKTLESVRRAAEIVVVDSFSTDRTLDIIRSLSENDARVNVLTLSRNRSDSTNR